MPPRKRTTTPTTGPRSATVGSYQRRLGSGKVVKVSPHKRRTRGRKVISKTHARRLSKRAFTAARRGRRGQALRFGTLALAEGLSLLVLQGVQLMLMSAVLLALSVCLALIGGK